MALESLADWGEDFLKNHADKIFFAKLFGWWDELVGPQIAAVSNPVYYKKAEAILLVEVSDHHWLGELHYHLPNIINKYHEKIHHAGLAEKISEIKAIKLKYNPHLVKPTSSTAESPHELQRNFSLLPDSIENVEINNVDEKLDRLLEIMKKYAAGDTPHTSLASPNTIPPESVTHHTAPMPKTARTAENIDRYYPRNGFYSEFIFPPDELQNFDLY